MKSIDNSLFTVDTLVLLIFIGVCLSAGILMFIIILISRVLKTHIAKRAVALCDQLQRTINVFALYEKQEGGTSSFPWNYHLQNLRKQLRGSSRKQLFVDLLIANKRNLTGRSALMLTKVYVRLGLKLFSVAKLTHYNNNVKIKGLHELAEMGCVQDVSAVASLLRHRNRRVRQEAFIATVQRGSFALLSDYSEPISDWMKIVVYRHLSALPVKQLPIFHTWIASPHPAVQKFALAMIRQFQQLDAIPTLSMLLRDKDLEVAAQAADILGDFGAASEADHIERLGRQHRHHEALSIAVIRALAKVGGTRHQSLLFFHMIHGAYPIRLEAIRALVKLKVNVLKIYIDFNLDNDKEFAALFAHISDPLLR